MSNEAMLLSRDDLELEKGLITELEKALQDTREQLEQEKYENSQKSERLQKLFEEIVVFQNTIRQQEMKEEKLTGELESVMLELANSKMQVSKVDKETVGTIVGLKRHLIIAYILTGIAAVLAIVAMVLYRRHMHKVTVKVKYIKSLLLHILVLMTGLFIAHLGVTLFILSNLGSDPYNVFVQGTFRSLQRLFGLPFLTHGYTHLFISFLIIVILLILDRTYIRIGTILCMAFGGPIIDLFSFLLRNIIHASLPYFVRILVLMAGCVILAYGMTIVIKSEAGTGPNDLVAIVVSDKIHKKFSLIRILVDMIFVAVGFVLGGVIGVGTVICAFLVGPVAGVFLPVNESVIKKIYNKIL